uniref:Uncharacterized protein n=1 Tax=Parvoviridae sp. TaxID=1940570 RepID=A0A7D3QKF8_9VIRU|nr:MAG: hypothetical protein [Parvoviridae sp.]
MIAQLNFRLVVRELVRVLLVQPQVRREGRGPEGLPPAQELVHVPDGHRAPVGGQPLVKVEPQAAGPDCRLVIAGDRVPARDHGNVVVAGDDHRGLFYQDRVFPLLVYPDARPSHQAFCRLDVLLLHGAFLPPQHGFAVTVVKREVAVVVVNVPVDADHLADGLGHHGLARVGGPVKVDRVLFPHVTGQPAQQRMRHVPGRVPLPSTELNHPVIVETIDVHVPVNLLSDFPGGALRNNGVYVKLDSLSQFRYPLAPRPELHEFVGMSDFEIPQIVNAPVSAQSQRLHAQFFHHPGLYHRVPAAARPVRFGTHVRDRERVARSEGLDGYVGPVVLSGGHGEGRVELAGHQPVGDQVRRSPPVQHLFPLVVHVVPRERVRVHRLRYALAQFRGVPPVQTEHGSADVVQSSPDSRLFDVGTVSVVQLASLLNDFPPHPFHRPGNVLGREPGDKENVKVDLAVGRFLGLPEYLGVRLHRGLYPYRAHQQLLLNLEPRALAMIPIRVLVKPPIFLLQLVVHRHSAAHEFARLGVRVARVRGGTQVKNFLFDLNAVGKRENRRETAASRKAHLTGREVRQELRQRPRRSGSGSEKSGQFEL